MYLHLDSPITKSFATFLYWNILEQIPDLSHISSHTSIHMCKQVYFHV